MLKRIPQPVYAVLALAALTGLFWLIGSRSSGGPRPGAPAPGFQLTDLAGRTATLAEYRGKVLLLDFWATWCDTCQEEVPWLKTLHARFHDRGLELVAASVDDTASPVQAFAARRELPYRVLLADYATARSYDVWGLPTKFLIDPEGLIYRRYVGEVTAEELEKDLEALLTRRPGAG